MFLWVIIIVMIYDDRIYGQQEITEPVILALINSPSFQRLKAVDQAGYFEPFYPGTAFSRLEHSIGVYLLLKQYNASLNEQIAGLLHDVSHSAFSHCIDYAVDQGSPKNHDHQDNIFKEFVLKTEIPEILKKYNIDVGYILNDHNFPLKERLLPDLCADRIDYSLRTAIIFKEIDLQFMTDFLAHLTTENNYWVFKDFNHSKTYAEVFSKLNDLYYAGFSSVVMFQTVGDLLKYSLKQKYISYDDLYTTDQQVLDKVKPYFDQDKQLFIFWQRMNNKIKAINSPKDWEVCVYVKSRAINPWFKEGDKKLKLSDRLPNWSREVTEKSQAKKYFLKFEQ